MAEMLVIERRKQRRATLIPSHVYKLRTMGFKEYPTSNRFFNLSQEEIQKVPWLELLADSVTTGFINPKTITPNKCTIADMKCEEMCQEYEKGDEHSMTEQGFLRELNKSNVLNYLSNPIVDVSSNAAQNKLAFPYSEMNKGMLFFHLKKVTLDTKVASLDVPKFINAFVFSKKTKEMKPLTETAFIVIESDGTNKMSTSKIDQCESLLFPYSPHEDCVLVIFVMFEENSIPNINGRPFSIGCINLPSNGNLPDPIESVFSPYIPGNSIDTYLQPKNQSPVKFIFEAEIVGDAVREKVVRLTAYDNMFPSPIFTIFDISLDFQHSIIKKKSGIYISVTLRKIFADPKCPDPKTIVAFMNSRNHELCEYGYSPMIMYSDKLVINEPLNFFIDPSLQESFSVVITVYLVGKSKAKQILVGNFQPTKPSEIHIVKMESKGSFLTDMKSALSRGDNTLRCSTIYPACVTPPPSVRPALKDFVSDQNILLDPMFKNIAPYVITKNLAIANLRNIDFRLLFNYFRCSDMATITPWIENFFTPEKGFTELFANKLGDSLDKIVDWPQPFFLILYKSMCNDEYNKIPLDETLVNRLFNKIALFKTESVNKSAGDLLLQLRMTYSKNIVHKITYNYMTQLDTQTRFFIFNYLFADVAFLQTLTLISFEEPANSKTRAQSPYIPLLSLYYRTVTNAFIENTTEAILAAAGTLSILAATLEQYVDDESAKTMAMTLFPLFAMIFTYFDSLCEKIPQISKILPIILFLLKSCNIQQFILYYNLLSSDNQLRFMEFLLIITDNTLQSSDMAANSVHFADHTLNCTFEITCRILIFMSFLDKIKVTDENMMRIIFQILFHMLQCPQQPAESFGLILKSMAFFVNQFNETVFVAKSTLINQILTAIVPLTQRKLLVSRVDSIGFILWLIEKEKKKRSKCDRCNIALQFAVCSSVFQNNNFVTFFDLLPSKEFSDVKNLHEKLTAALNDSTFHETTVQKLLRIYEQYKNFPSIRAEIYTKIIQINKENGNTSSAFVAQWKLCALIAEVFKQKKIVIDGIPTNGSDAFPFIVNESKVDLSVYPADSAYLVMDCDIFTENSISTNLQKALIFCQESGFHHLIGDITQFLFDFLEKHRKFSILEKLFQDATKSFVSMQKNENPQVEFARIFIKGQNADRFGFNNAIHILPLGTFDQYVADIKSQLVGIENLEDSNKAPIFKSDKENCCQIVRVKCETSELLKLNAKTFYYDDTTIVFGWDDKMATRYTFTIESPLPGCIATSNIVKVVDKSISKTDFYLEKLREIRDRLSSNVQSIEKIMPPPKMRQKWSQCVLGISASPLLEIYELIFTNERTKKKDYYSLVNELHNEQFDDESDEDIPESVYNLTDEVWQLMLDTVPLIKQISDINNLSQKESEAFIEYRKYLGIPIVSLDE